MKTTQFLGIVLILAVCFSAISFGLENTSILATEQLNFIFESIENVSLNKTNESVVLNETFVNETLTKLKNKTINKPKLAKKVGGKLIPTDDFTKKYIKNHNNFKDVKFEKTDKIKKFEIKNSRNVKKELKGLVIEEIKNLNITNNLTKTVSVFEEVNYNQYAFDLVWCKKDVKTCYIRINGVLFKDIKEGTVIDIDSENYINITTMKVDYCEKAVCDYLHESYDLIEFEVLSK